MLSKTFASLVRASTQGRSNIVQTALKVTAAHQTPLQGNEESSEQISTRQFSTQIPSFSNFAKPALLRQNSPLNNPNSRGYSSQNEATTSEIVGKNIQDVFLYIAKTQKPELAVYLNKAEEIEQGNDTTKKAEQYSKLWKSIGEDGGKELQSQFAETLGKAKDLKGKAQFFHELYSIVDSLTEEGKLSPGSSDIESILSAAPKKDGLGILRTFDQIYKNAQNSYYEENAHAITSDDIYSDSLVSPALIVQRLEKIQQVPMQDEPTLPDRLDVVPPIGTTIEQFTTKIGLLSNVFSRSQVQGKFDEAIESIEQDKNPTTGKLKKTLTNLAGYLADYAKDEFGPDNTKTPKEKNKREKDLFNTIDTVRILEEEADNVSKLEKFYVDMAKIVKIGKASSADTFFDNSVEIQYSKDDKMKKPTASENNSPSIDALLSDGLTAIQNSYDSNSLSYEDAKELEGMLLLSAAQDAIAQTMDTKKELQRNSDLSGMSKEINSRLDEYMNIEQKNEGKLHKNYYDKIDQNWDKLTSQGDKLQSYPTTQSQLVEKLGFLADFFEGSTAGDIIKDTQKSLRQEKDSSHDSQKETLYNLSGQLADNLKTELDLGEKPATEEDKEQSRKGISNIIEAVNILNDEMQGIDKIQQRNFDLALKPLSDRSGTEEFADKELLKAYSGMIESGDVPLGKEYWNNMRMLSSISSESRSVAIESDLIRTNEGRTKTPGLDSLKKIMDQYKETRSR